MRTAPDKAADDLVTLRDLFRDRLNHIRKGAQQHRDDLFETLTTLLLAGQRVQLYEVKGYEFIAGSQVPFIDNLFHEAEGKSFVCFRGHRTSSFSI